MSLNIPAPWSIWDSYRHEDKAWLTCCCQKNRNKHDGQTDGQTDGHQPFPCGVACRGISMGTNRWVWQKQKHLMFDHHCLPWTYFEISYIHFRTNPHIIYIYMHIYHIHIYIYIKYWLEISKVYHHPSNPHWLTTESLQVTVSLRHCHHYKASLKRGTTHGLWDPWLLYHHGIFYDFLTQTLEFRSRISTSMPVSKWLIYSR